MIQIIGGAITRAHVSHMSAAFPAASYHAICCAEIFEADVVTPVLAPRHQAHRSDAIL